MPALTQVDVEVRTFNGWAARRPEDRRYLRRVDLAPCTSSSPDACLLRGTCELPWGEDPGAAIRTLVTGEATQVWSETTTTRKFAFEGPVAQIDDVATETELLSTESASPLWESLRGLATDRRLGMIELNQLKRLMVPIFAFGESGAQVNWMLGPESVFPTALAFPGVEAGEDEDW
ncbi:MAG TPA: hypothetical protein VFS64_05430 [Solirubrobacterales bacterium]|nr:hypothetical protein [Solirubrobacterales bacterium]